MAEPSGSSSKAKPSVTPSGLGSSVTQTSSSSSSSAVLGRGAPPVIKRAAVPLGKPAIAPLGKGIAPASAPTAPHRLSSVHSESTTRGGFTIGGVKKKVFTPNISAKKKKEEKVEEDDSKDAIDIEEPVQIRPSIAQIQRPRLPQQPGVPRAAVAKGDSKPKQQVAFSAGGSSGASGFDYINEDEIRKKREKQIQEQESFETRPEGFPTTLPFVTQKRKEGAMDVVKKEKSDAASLSLTGESSFMEDQLMFFQLPSILPFETEATDATSGDSEVGVVPTTAEGLVGKLLVFKSGKVKLKLGNILYDVSPGTKVGFAQDIAVVKCPPAPPSSSSSSSSSTPTSTSVANLSDQMGSMYILGEVSKTVVCTPDWEQLLS